MTRPKPGTVDAFAALVHVAPIVRGLLAEPTGNEDFPHAPVLLSCLADARARLSDEDERSGLALSLDPLLPCDDADAFRRGLADAVERFAATHDRKPDHFIATGAGSLAVAPAADTRAAEAATAPALHGRVAVVTGAAGAIGYAVCRTLLDSGCRVAATDLPGERLDALAEDLNAAAPGRVRGVAMDVTDRAAVADGFRQVVEAWGGVDIVVHNAGIALVATIAEMDLEAFRRLERVNVDGTLLVLAAAGDLFKRQGTGGDVVIMSTKNVPSPSAGFGAYSATKAACHQLGRIASLEMAPLGVRVNMVAPDAVFAEGDYKSGLWETVGADRMKVRGLDEAGLHEYYRQRNLLKARVTGRHVANAVLFFVSRQTPTTGATIPVDGGLPDATPR